MRCGSFRFVLLAAFFLAVQPNSVSAENKFEYANKFVFVMDWAIKSNNYLRQHITDRGLAKHLQEIALKHVELCSVWTPPEEFKPLHPHFVLLLENAERAYFYAGKGTLSGYRKHHRVMRSEMRMIDALIDKYRIKLPEAPR